MALLFLPFALQSATVIPHLPAEFNSSSFVIAANGELYAWGMNNYGQLGVNFLSTRAPYAVLTPTLVPRPEGVHSWQMVSGAGVTAAIGDDGNLYRWGNTNYASSGGGFQLLPMLVPRPAAVNRWLFVNAGNSKPIALGDDGNLYQWDAQHQREPLIVPKPNGVKSWLKVTAGRSYYLGLASHGELFQWGNAYDGVITLEKIERPAQEPLGPGATPRAAVTHWIDASSSVYHRLALGDNGEIYQWSYAVPFQRISRPARVSYWKGISAGANISAAIGSDDRLYTWATAGAEPTSVPFPEGVQTWISFSAGSDASINPGSVLMIGNNCRLYGFGNNTWGQLGTGNTMTYTDTPVFVNNLERLCMPQIPPTKPGVLTLVPFPPRLQTEGEFRIHLFGNSDEPLVLLRSGDLNSWIPVLTNLSLTDWAALTDLNSGRARSAFYRLARGRH